jgi:hypothetical protein
MLDRLFSIFVAVGLALLIWLYAKSRDQEILDHVPVPVRVELAAHQGEQYTLEVVGPSQVLATFTGSPARIRELRGLLQREELRVELTMTVPAERLKESRLSEVLTVEAADLHAPPGVITTVVAGRNQVRVVLHRLVERTLPVRFDQSLATQLGPVVVEPSTVLVRGPQEVLERLTAISTQPSVLPHRSERRSPMPSVRVPLVREVDGRSVGCDPPFVRVHASGRAYKTYPLSDVPVQFLCPESYPLRPRFNDDRAGRISLRVRGPAQDEPPRVFAFVDLSRLPARQGFYSEPIQLQLPRDFQLDGDPAVRNAAFELVPVDTPAKGLGAVPGSKE